MTLPSHNLIRNLPSLYPDDLLEKSKRTPYLSSKYTSVTFFVLFFCDLLYSFSISKRDTAHLGRSPIVAENIVHLQLSVALEISPS